MAKYNLSEANIESLATGIMLTLDELELDRDVCVYYNNIRGRYTRDGWEWDTCLHPRQYCQDASFYNILTITSEGPLYDYYDRYFEMPKQITELMEEFGLYFECATNWCWSAYLLHDSSEYEEIAYDKAPKEPETVRISIRNPACPFVLKNIMEYWWALSSITKGGGCCVYAGSAGFRFEYNKVKYFMESCSPSIDEGTWVPHVPFIKQMLEKIGATNIVYEYGRMD